MGTKSFTLRIDGQMLDKLHIIAEYEGRSANGQLTVMIRDLIKEYEDRNGEIEIK